MGFLDWLLGECYVGWLKTALLSVLLAVPIVMLTLAPEDLDGGGSRFLVIAMGYPILALVRHLYWNWREQTILSLIDTDRRLAVQQIEEIKPWRPALWLKLDSRIKWIESRADVVDTSGSQDDSDPWWRRQEP